LFHNFELLVKCLNLNLPIAQNSEEHEVKTDHGEEVGEGHVVRPSAYRVWCVMPVEQQRLFPPALLAMELLLASSQPSSRKPRHLTH
jgi:hypothetical protein